MSAPAVRPAVRDDVPAIHALLRDFGRYWHHADWVSGTEAALADALFGPVPRGMGHVACAGGSVIGVALWFVTYNFWVTRPILYLEDLFVAEAARGSGAGAALMRALAAEALARDCAWMSWTVRDEDEGAARFYAGLGALPDRESRPWRLEGEALERLAAR